MKRELVSNKISIRLSNGIVLLPAKTHQKRYLTFDIAMRKESASRKVLITLSNAMKMQQVLETKNQKKGFKNLRNDFFIKMSSNSELIIFFLVFVFMIW